jgi:hypothetical protein
MNINFRGNLKLGIKNTELFLKFLKGEFGENYSKIHSRKIVFLIYKNN